MKNFINLILIAFAILQISCTKSKNLKPDDVAKEVFTATELKGIMKMINYVDKLVVEKTNVQDVNQAYHTYLESLKPYLGSGEWFPAPVKDTIKFKFLESLDKDAFDAIWRMSNSVRRLKYKDIDLRDLEGFKNLKINSAGSVMDYFARIGESDERYKETNEAIKIAGDMGPSMVSWLPAHHSEYDFTTFKDRLWATVILLRIGDPIEEKVERYLRKKTSETK